MHSKKLSHFMLSRARGHELFDAYTFYNLQRLKEVRCEVEVIKVSYFGDEVNLVHTKAIKFNNVINSSEAI